MGERSRIGWIGTGRMGHAMAERLLAAGADLSVWNRTRSKAEDLAQAGATVVDTLADLADRDIVFTTVAAVDLAQAGATVVDTLADLADRDIVFTTVAADDDLIEVMMGTGGLLRH